MSRAEAALLVTVSGLLLTGCVSMGDSDAQVSPNSATDERGLNTAKGEEVEVVAEESSLPPVGGFDYAAPDFDLLRVSDSLCAGVWFTSSPRIGRGKPRLVG